MLGRIRWVPVWFLFTGGMINYMDRSAVSVSAPFLMKDLGLNAAQLGVIFSGFFAGYALFTFVGGYASDVLGPKRVFSLAMAVWSMFCGLTAATVGFTSLLLVRIFFGCGEGPFGAATNKMVANWFPRREIATAVGVANAGTPIGGALAGPFAGWFALHYGWRMTFVVLAGIGFLWIVFWVVFVVDQPETHSRLSDSERAEIAADRPPIRQSEGKLPLSFYLRHSTVLATGFSFFGYAYVLYFFLTWFPGYLTMAWHLDIRNMAFLNTIPWILGTVGLASSGVVCDFLSRVTGDVLRARKLVLSVCLAIAGICVGLAGFVPELTWAVVFMTITVFSLYLTGATYWAIIQETVQGEHVGAVSGFVHLIANCAGVIGPAVTGFIVQTTGTFTSAFLLAGAFALLGAGLVTIFVRRS